MNQTLFLMFQGILLNEKVLNFVVFRGTYPPGSFVLTGSFVPLSRARRDFLQRAAQCPFLSPSIPMSSNVAEVFDLMYWRKNSLGLFL